MFQRVLICTDFSDGLYRLIDFVPSLAAGGLKQIVFMHSVPLWQEGGIPRVDAQRVKKAIARLSAALQSVPEGVEVKVEVPSGRTGDNILEVAKTYKSELIILGMASRSLLTEKLFGSDAMDLAQRTSIPLLIFRPQLISAYMTGELQLRCQNLGSCLLIPYNDSAASKSLIQQLKHFIQKQPAHTLKQCILCWVIQEVGRRDLPPDYYRQQVEQAQKTLAAIAKELEQLSLEVKIEVRQGNPMLEILDAGLIFDISAIAVSSQHMGKILEWPVPSFTAELMRRSWHPVLFFPMPR